MMHQSRRIENCSESEAKTVSAFVRVHDKGSLLIGNGIEQRCWQRRPQKT